MTLTAHIVDAITFLGGTVAPRPEPTLPADIPAHDHRPGVACPRCTFAVEYPMYHAKVALFVAEAEQAAMPPTAIAALARAMVAYSSGYRKPAGELLALALGRALRDGGATPEDLGLAPAAVATSSDLLAIALDAVAKEEHPDVAAYLAGVAASPALSPANRVALFEAHMRGQHLLPTSIVMAIAAKLEREAIKHHADATFRQDRLDTLPYLRAAGYTDQELWEQAMSGLAPTIIRHLVEAGRNPADTTPFIAALGVRPLAYALWRHGSKDARALDLAATLIDFGATIADGDVPPKAMVTRMLGAKPIEPLSIRVAPLAGRSSRCTAYHWLARIVESHDDMLPALPESDRAWLAEQAAAASTSYGLRVLAALSAAAA